MMLRTPAVFFAILAAPLLAQNPASPTPRELLKQLIEINTTNSVGDNISKAAGSDGRADSAMPRIPPPTFRF